MLASTVQLQPVVFLALGVLLLTGGLIYCAIKFGWLSGWSSAELSTVTRGADDPPPPGSVQWVQDICDSMGKASSASMLKALQNGLTRDQARAERIKEQESTSLTEKSKLSKGTS